MAGHSKFKNIQHRKNAQDAKRSKIFTKIIREITNSIRYGADPEYNYRLRSALNIARNNNVPKDNIDKAIKSASNKDANSYEEIRYECFIDGVAIIVESLTDNRNRTVSDLRAILTKNNGRLAEISSLLHMFKHVGIIEYDKQDIEFDKLFELAVDLGASDVFCQGEIAIIYTGTKDLFKIAQGLENDIGVPKDLYLGWITDLKVKIEDLDKLDKIEKVLDVIENLDDVQRVFTNLS